MRRMKSTVKILSYILTLLFIIQIIPFCVYAETSQSNTNVQTEIEYRKTPIMGWSSWNYFHTDISEDVIISQVDAIVNLGLDDVGYDYVNIDDGWQNGRDDDVVHHQVDKFPNGMKYIADYAHNLGIKAGMYTDGGETTCGWITDEDTTDPKVGLYGHDEQDLRMYFVDWGYDFIKVDWCGGAALELSTQTRYTEIGEAINNIEKELNKDLIYNVCCWGFPGEWVVDVADSWRTGGDIAANFDSILTQIDNIKELTQYAGPGHVNDLDMLQVGNGMSYEEDKTHFSMWCMMSSPLLIGTDLTTITDQALSILKNEEIIALDQDSACLQATVEVENENYEVWVKPLGSSTSSTKAVALLNRSDSEQVITVNWADLGLSGVMVARDLWLHQDIVTGDSYTATVPAHGIVVLKVSGNAVIEDPDFLLQSKLQKTETEINLTEAGKSDWACYGIDENKKGPSTIDEIAISGAETSEASKGTVQFNWTNGTNNSEGSTKSALKLSGSDTSAAITFLPKKTKQTASIYLSGKGRLQISSILNGKITTEEFNLENGTSYCYSVNFASGSTSGMTVTLTPAEGTQVFLGASSLMNMKTESGEVLLSDTYIYESPLDISLATASEWISFSGENGNIAAQKGDSLFDFITSENAVIISADSKIEFYSGSKKYNKGAMLTSKGSSITLQTANNELIRKINIYFSVSNASVKIITNAGDSIDIVAGATEQSKMLTIWYQSNEPLTVEFKLSSKFSDDGYFKLDAATISGENEYYLSESDTSVDGNKLIVSAKSINTENFWADKVNFIAALYNENNIYCGSSISTASIDTTMSDISIDVELSDGFSGYVRTYLWGGNEFNIPLSDSRETFVSTVTSVSDSYEKYIGPITAKDMVEKGAILLDVRTETEYIVGHIDGSINIPHTEIITRAGAMLPDKNVVIITYCSAAKRSVQAQQMLSSLGYNNVYILGSMSNWDTNISIEFDADSMLLVQAGDNIKLKYTEYRNDSIEIFCSAGKDSDFDDAIPYDEFIIPDSDDDYIAVKAYIAYNGKVYAECEKQFINYKEDIIDIYASDLDWVSSSVGWGTIHKDKSIDGNPLRISGVPYPKGIGTHANSKIKIAIPEGATRFLAVVGYDDEVLGNATDNKMQYSVYLDDELYCESEILKVGRVYVFDVIIPEGTETITLKTDQAYDNNWSDHADWAISGFIK